MTSSIITPTGFDRTAYGDVVELSTPSGLSLTLVEKGLHIPSIKFQDKAGQEHDIIIGSDDPVHYVDEKAFRHGLVGRYVNMLPAETPLSLPSGDTISLPSFPSTGGSLHGGPSPFGWDEKILARVPLDESTLFSRHEVDYIRRHSAGIWSLLSPDGEGGHCGTVYCEIAVLVTGSMAEGDLGQVVLVYRAKVLDRPSTALNLTHHWGFNLSASGIARGQPTPANDISIERHMLLIKASEILNFDPEHSMPSGTTLPLSTPSAAKKDFRKGKTIGRVGEGYPTGTGDLGQGSLSDGYCDFWIFDRDGRQVVMKETGLVDSDVFHEINKDREIVAALSSPETGISIAFTTNQPGMQGWSGTPETYDGSDARKRLHGGRSVRGEGDGYRNEMSGAAFAMEFHAIYGAWLHPELQKKAWGTILNKGEIYNNWVCMTVRSE